MKDRNCMRQLRQYVRRCKRLLREARAQGNQGVVRIFAAPRNTEEQCARYAYVRMCIRPWDYGWRAALKNAALTPFYLVAFAYGTAVSLCR